MQLIFGLFLIVTAACAIAQEYSTASITPIQPDAVQRPSPEPPGPENATSISTRAADLPDAPSYTIPQSSVDASTVQPQRSLGIITNHLAVSWDTPSLSPISKQFLSVAAPSSARYPSLIFAGGTSSGAEFNGPPEQLDGRVSGSGTNCRHASADKIDGSGWFISFLSITSKGERYCALGEGGFWKRGTYAATRAFASHRFDGANSFNMSDIFAPGPGFPATGYYPYQKRSSA